MKTKINEEEGSQSIEQILELLAVDFQRYASKNVPNLSHPTSTCLDTDDVFEGVKYDTYGIDSFPIFYLSDGQYEDAYTLDRCDSVDSYVDMNSDFDMHCILTSVKHMTFISTKWR